MNQMYISTRGAGTWRERLASPEKQWKREYSAFETAVSWEWANNPASKSISQLPTPIEEVLRNSIYKSPEMLFAVAEHKVPLDGKGGDSQCDVWAVVLSEIGLVSMSVEAKANEPFGQSNESLEKWLTNTVSDTSRANRNNRWKFIEKNLPDAKSSTFMGIPYQMLHRCAAAVIEAKRLNISHAVFLVQAFNSPKESFEVYSSFCSVLGHEAKKGKMLLTEASGISLGIGWVDCPFASDKQVASVI